MRPFIIAIETFEIDIQEIPWHCRCVWMASFFDASLSIATDMQIFTLAKWMGILYIYIRWQRHVTKIYRERKRPA